MKRRRFLSLLGLAPLLAPAALLAAKASVQDDSFQDMLKASETGSMGYLKGEPNLYETECYWSVFDASKGEFRHETSPMVWTNSTAEAVNVTG